MVVIDTSFIIDHLRQSPENSVLLKLFNRLMEESFSVSVITLQELFAGKSTRVPEKEKEILTVVSAMDILPYTFETAKKAGEIIRDEKPYIEFADAAIAATAILNKTTLATLNKKDFKGIKGLELI